MSRITGGLVAVAAVLGIIGGTHGVVSATEINVSPGTVERGGDVRLSGDILVDGVPGCDVTDTVTLISDAFAGLDEFAGVGAVFVPLDATGHFDTTVTLTSSVAAGSYSVGGRCGGGNLGISATIVVVALPPTGPSVVLQPLITAATALVAAGVAALILARRRRVPIGPTT